LEQNGVLPEGRRLVGPGLHREARIHFKVYNQLLPLHCEGTPGIMHWTYPVPLYLRGWINIYTVHDMIPLGGDGLSPISPSRHRRLIREIARKADRLITISESARADIITMLGCAPNFVVNGSQAAPVPSDIACEAPEGLPSRGYFLYCGSVEPRKNLERLVEAYRCSGTSKPLVIAGPDGWQAERVKRRIAHVKGVYLLPFQTRERLLGLLQHARALLFPSLAEGFGLPVAEAMAMGTPVMASSIETLAEVTRDCALLVDPLRVEQMSDVIGRLCQDDELCDQMAIKGLARSLEFSSSRYFERLSTIYGDLGKIPASGLGM
jgi:glycosyltransferase involved in cell wall biosynthesis